MGVKYAVICLDSHEMGACNNGKSIEISAERYMAEMSRPDSRWRCPECGGNADFDQETYEASLCTCAVQEECAMHNAQKDSPSYCRGCGARQDTPYCAECGIEEAMLDAYKEYEPDNDLPF